MVEELVASKQLDEEMMNVYLLFTLAVKTTIKKTAPWNC